MSLLASPLVRPRIAIVDTGSGNLRSVEKALTAAGADVFVSADASLVARADKIVVPGQGAFGACIAGLQQGGGALRGAVVEALAKGTPYLGLCLGLQILFDGSEEDPNCRGLGVIPGRVVRFVPEVPGTPGGNGNGAAAVALGIDRVGGVQAAPAQRMKIPHMGWNACLRGPAAARTTVLADTPEGTSFYFVHSYYAVPADPRDVALHTDHGVDFCAAVARDNVFACQFHPEKSQGAGLSLLRRFVSG